MPGFSLGHLFVVRTVGVDQNRKRIFLNKNGEKFIINTMQLSGTSTNGLKQLMGTRKADAVSIADGGSYGNIQTQKIYGGRYFPG